MSKQVDERVVSLQFDNKRFESNVSQSMSTLDKLKEKLHLRGASKGFEEVNAAAKKVDMSGLEKGVESVKAKFSSLDVIAVTALANITNSVVNAGKQMIASLTVAPIKDGFNEYEMTLNSIQTTMSATGLTAEEVQKELKKLDEYADKTVYSTADMLSNLPKFTNAGVELPKATKAMIGIANATALAGGDASKASIAFYNLGQAIGTGYLTRMDYNSINNAGIATMEWKNQMVDAAIAAGTLTKAGDDLYTAGGKNYTLQQLFIDGLQQQWATTDVMMKVFGDYGDETTEIGKKSYSAAQDIKTFSMMMDSLKATAGTGWKDTWQIIFGDLDGAKKMWTRLANAISAVITKITDVRNGILNSALGRTFTHIGETIKAAMDRVSGAVNTAKGAMDKVSGAIDKVNDALLDYDTLVNQIIKGEWGNAPTRWQDLAAAGYDWAHAQNLVNERLGCSVRHATNYKEAQDGVTKSQEKAVEAETQLTKADAERLEELLKLTDAELEVLGYTKEEIEAFRELERLAKKLGLPISELLANLDKINGRWLMIEGFANLGKALTNIFGAMKAAWKEIFESDGVSTIQKIGNAIFNLIAAFHRFTRKLSENTEVADKFRRIFRGVFALLKAIWTLIGGPIKLVIKVISKILKALGVTILDILAVIGDALYAVSSWISNLFDFGAIFNWMTPYIQKAADAIRNWFNETKPIGKVTAFFGRLGNVIVKAFQAFKNSKAFQVGKNIIAGLWQGIKSGATTLWNIITDVIGTLITKAEDLLGIKSPSRVFMAIGGFIVAGLVLGLSKGYPEAWNSIKGFFGKIVDYLKNINWGSILATAVSVGMVLITNKFATALQGFMGMFEGLGEFLERVGVNLGKYLKAKAWEARSKAIRDFAIAIGILAASIWLLTKIESGKLWEAIGAIGVLAGILGGLMFVIGAMNKIGKVEISKAGVSMTKTTSQILAIAASMLLIAIAVKKLAGLTPTDLYRSAAVLVALSGVLVGLMAATKLVNTGINKVGGTFLAMAAAILILTIVVKRLSKLEPAALTKGIFAMALLGSFIVGMMAATKLAKGGLQSVGSAILGISAAILLLAFTAKVISKMEPEAIAKGAVGISIFGGLVAALIRIVSIGNDTTIAKVGGTILAVSVAMLLMAATVGMIGTMDVKVLAKGVAAVAIFAAIISGLVYTIGSYGKQVKGIAFTILSLALAIAILVGVTVLIGLLSVEHLAKGIVAMTLLSTMMAVMIRALKGAQNVKSSLVIMVIAIAVLAGAVVGLSFLDPAKVAVAAGAMVAMVGVFALLIYLAKTAKEIKPGEMIKSFGLILLVMVVMAGIIVVLSLIKADTALKTIAGLALLMVTMAVCLKLISTVGKVGSGAIKGVLLLTAMAVPLLAFAAVLWVMGKMNIASSVKNVLALAIIVTVCTLLLPILAAVGSLFVPALLGIVCLTALAVPLLAFVGIILLMGNLESAGKNVLLLITMMVAFTLLLPLIALCGALFYPAIIGMGCLIALSTVMLTFVGILFLMDHIENASDNVDLILHLINGMMDVLMVLAPIAGKATLGAIALTLLAGVITAMSSVVLAIGALTELCPSAQEFIDVGLEILISLAGGLGEMISAFAVGLTSGLPVIGQALSDFITKAQGFINGAKLVDNSVLKGVGILTAAILALTTASLITGINSLMPMMPSFGTLGRRLTEFMINAHGFIRGAMMISPKVASGIEALSTAILSLTGASLLEGIGSFFSRGESPLVKFAKKLPIIGEGLGEFNKALVAGGVTDQSITIAKTAAEVIGIIADASEKLPNSGGWLGKIVGDNDMGVWCDQLPNVGTGVSDFVKALVDGKVSEDSIEIAKKAAEIVVTLAEAAKEIPNDGGWLGKICGENNLALWSENLPKVGTGIVDFCTSLKTYTISDTDVTNAERAAKIIVAVADAEKTIKNTGGLVGAIFGEEMDLDTWAENLDEVGMGVEAFCDELTDITPEQVKLVDSIVPLLDAITAIAEYPYNISSVGYNLEKNLAPGIRAFINAFADVDAEKGQVQACTTQFGYIVDAMKSLDAINDTDKIMNFGKALEKNIGPGIRAFILAFDGVDSVTGQVQTCVTQFGYIVAAMKDVDSINTSTLTAFGDALNALGTDSINKFIAAFASSSLTEENANSVKNLTTNIINTLNSTDELAKYTAAGVAVVDGFITGLKDETNLTEITAAGVAAVAGFINGLKDPTKMAEVTAAGTALGKAALGAAKAALDEHSPSREMYKVGDYAGAGLINALYDNVSGVYKAGREMASSALNGSRSVMSRIVDAINSDMDAQPSIRPVLDLTDVRSGVNSIGNMLSGTRTLSVNAAGIGAISATMSKRQNGNDGLVSAINNLARNNDKSGNTYNINGISYNEGSDVADAIQTLVRAVTIEGRT